MTMHCWDIPSWVARAICVFGLIGNMIAFYTFGKFRNQNASTYLFRALAVMDSLLLIRICSQPIFKRLGDSFWESVAYCFLMQVYGLAHTATIWTILLVGVHRYIIVCKPLKATTVCTASNARRHILGVLLLSLTVNFPLFFEYGIKEVTSNNTDYIAYKIIWSSMKESSLYWTIYRVVFHDVIVNYVIPVGSLIFITVRLLQSLRSSRQRRIELSEGQRRGQTNGRTEWMVIVVLIMFLLCQTALPVRFVLARFANRRGPGDNFCKSARFIMFSFSNNMILLNSSINIIIYIGFNRNFRKTLCRCVKPSTSRPNNQQLVTLTWGAESVELLKRVFVDDQHHYTAMESCYSWFLMIRYCRNGLRESEHV